LTGTVLMRERDIDGHFVDERERETGTVLMRERERTFCEVAKGLVVFASSRLLLIPEEAKDCRCGFEALKVVLALRPVCSSRPGF
jgi:hypothetical protein